MNTDRRIQIAQARIESQKDMIHRERWQTCINCVYWQQEGQKRVPDPSQYSGSKLVPTEPSCKKYQVLPPTNILVVGCEEHEFDIPF